MLNRIILIGRLTRDPELRYTPQGVARTTFSLAVERPFANAQGQREADFIDCVAWRKLGETIGNHLSKGRLIAVEGRVQVRSYEASDGTKRRVTEVVTDSMSFLDSPKDGKGNPTSSDENSPANESDIPFPDDLPF
jgi:single-strand DNA-binding protein